MRTALWEEPPYFSSEMSIPHFADLLARVDWSSSRAQIPMTRFAKFSAVTSGTTNATNAGRKSYSLYHLLASSAQ